MKTKPISPEEQETNEKEPAYTLVAECLYKSTASGKYYGLIKRGNKQFRRSLKTKDRTIAERKLAELRKKVGKITCTNEDTKADFFTLATHWLALRQAGLSRKSVEAQTYHIKSLQPFFPGTIRNANRSHVENWLLKRGQDLAGSTFSHELSVLKGVLAYAEEA